MIPQHSRVIATRERAPFTRRTLWNVIFISLVLAFIALNHKSPNYSDYFANEQGVKVAAIDKSVETQQTLLAAQNALQAKITAIETKQTGEREALEAKIAYLEGKLAEATTPSSLRTNEGAQISPQTPLNDCLYHVNHVRGITLFSQNDEDGALLQTLNCIGGHGTKEYFEFGSENGNEVNTRVLRELYGWHGHLLDGRNENPDIPLHKEFFTPSNIISLMQKYNVSKELDVLSVDCDIDDFYVTREIFLGGYRPRVVINEFNINFGWEWSVAVQPKPVGEESNPAYFWKGDCYYGASAKAFISLMKAFGYSPVFANTVNLIFVRIDKARELGLALPSPEIFPGPLVRALHPDCPNKTWKIVGSVDIENAVNPSISHVDFANGMDEIVLDCKTFINKKTTVSSVIPLNRQVNWRIFTEIAKAKSGTEEKAKAASIVASQSATVTHKKAESDSKSSAYDSYLELRKILFQCDGDHEEPVQYWTYYFDCNDKRLLPSEMGSMLSKGKSMSNSMSKVRFKGTDVEFAGQTIDFLVAELFFLHPTPQYQGRYLEIGGYFGLEFSNSLFFDQYLGWDGWLFEPTSCYSEMVTNRPRAASFKQGLCKERVENMSFNGFGKCSASNAPCMPLTDMDGWEEGFDFASIDVEGAEMNVLEAIDFTKVKIKVLVVEWVNANRDTREEYLKKFGYVKVARFMWQGWGNADEIYYRPDLISFHIFDSSVPKEAVSFGQQKM